MKFIENYGKIALFSVAIVFFLSRLVFASEARVEVKGMSLGLNMPELNALGFDINYKKNCFGFNPQVASWFQYCWTKNIPGNFKTIGGQLVDEIQFSFYQDKLSSFRFIFKEYDRAKMIAIDTLIKALNEKYGPPEGSIISLGFELSPFFYHLGEKKLKDFPKAPEYYLGNTLFSHEETTWWCKKFSNNDYINLFTFSSLVQNISRQRMGIIVNGSTTAAPYYHTFYVGNKAIESTIIDRLQHADQEKRLNEEIIRKKKNEDDF